MADRDRPPVHFGRLRLPTTSDPHTLASHPCDRVTYPPAPKGSWGPDTDLVDLSASAAKDSTSSDHPPKPPRVLESEQRCLNSYTTPDLHNSSTCTQTSGPSGSPSSTPRPHSSVLSGPTPVCTLTVRSGSYLPVCVLLVSLPGTTSRVTPDSGRLARPVVHTCEPGGR